MPRPRLAWPERIPVRWRIAITCASLTFLILVIFAGVLGNLVGDRVRDDFNDELAGAAGALAAEFNVGMDPQLGAVIDGPRIDDSAMADGAVIRIVDSAGNALRTTNQAVQLGPPHDGVSDVGLFSVASERIDDDELRSLSRIRGLAFPQAAQLAAFDASDVDTTATARCWVK